MHRLLQVLAFALLFSFAQAAQESQIPSGKNCNLSAPPVESGEDAFANIVLLVHPRAINLEAGYSGCQVVWFGRTDGTSMPSGWSVMSVALIERGNLVRLWSPLEGMESNNACRFSNRAPAAGNPKTCRYPEEFPAKSFPAGCLAKAWAAEGRMPDECMKHE